MTLVGTINGDLHVAGALTARELQIPDGSLHDDGVAAAANIAASKLEHQWVKTFAQGSAVTAVDATQPIHVVHGTTGAVVAIEAGCVVACIGDSTVAIDLLLNGVSILTAPISIDSGDAAYAKVGGAIDDGTLADGDVLEVDVDATVGTGTLGTGLFVAVTITEKAA
jgi:hypothetical protein